MVDNRRIYRTLHTCLIVAFEPESQLLLPTWSFNINYQYGIAPRYSHVPCRGIGHTGILMLTVLLVRITQNFMRRRIVYIFCCSSVAAEQLLRQYDVASFYRCSVDQRNIKKT